ncbi:MAG: precorrin-8X methylmutase [Ilumatobacteraceae bacterium]|nr:precorrin-8X methylmutase [Ilumatobacteraceae bacterium]MCU1389104.1 precorrin-8X methylmutase [Ilumatobacteraceae bacterium]
MRLDYERDGAAIYTASFATIRREADLSSIAADLEPAAVRIIHACGDVDIVRHIEASADFADAARQALANGCTIWCDSNMVAHGITRTRLPAGNPVRCALRDDGIATDAIAARNTRSAVAVDRWLDDLDGALAVIGNAPTALFRLLELVLDGAAKPAAIIGIPVGFIGAAESKHALATLDHHVPYLTVHGRRGGSAMAAAAVNALASSKE